MKKIIILLSFFCSMQDYAQEKYRRNSYDRLDIDTNYIKDVSNKLIIKLLFDRKENEVTFFNKDDNKLILLPNQASKIALVLDYKWIGFAIGLPQKYSPLKVDTYLKGTSKNIHFEFNFFFNKWMQTVNYEKTMGYYIVNTLDFVDEWKQGIDPYLQTDLSIEKIGGTTNYIFNADRFSYRSFLHQTQIQKISTGSLISTLSYYYTLKNNNLENPYNYYQKSLSLNLQTGYQYNWVIMNQFLLSSGIYGGLGITGSKSYEDITSYDPHKTFYGTNISIKMNLNLTHHYKSFFYGGKFKTHSFTEKDNTDSTLFHSYNYGAVFLGYIFDAPAVLKKSSLWIETQI